MTRTRKLALGGWAFIGAQAILWEVIGLRRAGDEWPTATDLIRLAPAWLVWMLLGWVIWHFGLSRG